MNGRFSKKSRNNTRSNESRTNRSKGSSKERTGIDKKSINIDKLSEMEEKRRNLTVSSNRQDRGKSNDDLEDVTSPKIILAN